MTPKDATVTTGHFTASTTQRRETTHSRVRALTVLTTAGTVLGTAGVAWAISPPAAVPQNASPQATSITATTAPAAPVSQPRPRVAVPKSLTKRTTRLAAPAPVKVRRQAAAPAPVTSSGSS